MPVRSQVGPVGGDFVFDFPAVEESDGQGTVFHFFGPDFEVIGLCDAAGLFAQGILVDIEHFVIGEEIEGELIELGQVAAD